MFQCDLDSSGTCLFLVEYPNDEFLASALQFITLCPCALFCLYLSFRMSTATSILRRTESLILRIYYILVWAVCLLSAMILVMSLTVHRSQTSSRIGQSLLTLLDFLCIFLEDSIIFFFVSSAWSAEKNTAFFWKTAIFSFIFSMLDAAAEIYTITQSDATCIRGFLIGAQGYAALYMAVSNAILVLVYVVFLAIPHTKWRYVLPAKRSYYLYFVFMCCIDLLNTIAGFLMGDCKDSGLCVSAVAYLFCFGLFPIAIYCAFLREYLSPGHYATLMNEVDDGIHAVMPISTANLTQMMSVKSK
eukprot:ANDGO_06703.mRNA.1 Transmembrane protein adipocyte-associated 1 homolog OS=Danio rerio GN=tpra1 PE=2 SV=1